MTEETLVQYAPYLIIVIAFLVQYKIFVTPSDLDKKLSDLKTKIENRLDKYVLKETNEFIGDCGITIQNIDGEMLPEIGYHIHKKYWRQGFAKEAAQAVRDWGFKNTPYDTFYSYMKYSNIGSYSTAIAIGMRKIKEYPDPKNTVSYAYGITSHQWDAMEK